VTATGRGSLAAPMGTVDFYVSAPGLTQRACDDWRHLSLLGTSALVPATGKASAVLSGVTTEHLGEPGTHTVIACFSGDGANDAPSSNTTTVTIR
jgi:hypothetical protein